MSSLFGAITSAKKEITAEQMIMRNQIVRGLAVYSESKGTNAIGIGLVNRNEYVYLKQVIGATEFLQTPAYKKFMLDYSPLIIIGHTKNLFYNDEKSSDSAHPFIKGTIMGSHVGTLTDFEKIDPKAKVDSEAIFTLLNREKNDYQKVFAELEGSFALSWIDGLSLDKVFLGKKEMPLFISFSQELKTYFWCSAKEPFTFLYEVKRNTVYEIDTNLKTRKTDVSFKTTIEEKSTPNCRWQGETWYEKKEREEKEAIEKIIYPESFSKSLNEIQKEFKNGCEMCQQKIDVKGLGFYWNKKEGFIVCPPCTNLFGKNDWKLFDFITTTSLLQKVGTEQKTLIAI